MSLSLETVAVVPCATLPDGAVCLSCLTVLDHVSCEFNGIKLYDLGSCPNQHCVRFGLLSTAFRHAEKEKG